MGQQPADEADASRGAHELPSLDEAASVIAGGNDVLREPPLLTPDLDSDSTEPAIDLPADATDDREAAPPEHALIDLTAAVNTMIRQVGAFHARAENYEQTIRQMQARIEQLQGDQVQSLLKPIIQRIAGLHSQAIEAAEQASARGEVAENDFSFFAVAIEEALGLVDIESVGAVPSALFEAGKHHAARVVPTQEPDLDRRIERVLRQGFTYIGAQRVFLPAQVSVYRFDASPSSEAHSESQTSNRPPEGSEGASSE